MTSKMRKGVPVMDAKLIDRFWNAQFADPDYKDIQRFIGGMYSALVPYRKWAKVCKAYDRFMNMNYTKDDMLCILHFYLEAKSVYKRAKKIIRMMDSEGRAEAAG